MFTKINKNWFTIVELLVWIALIGIIILWATSIDYNRLNNKQKLEIFTNQIKSNFERVRNNSLAWKWIWANLEIPDKWTIEYSKSNSWTIVSNSYTWTNITEFENILFQNGFYISSIKCWLINEEPSSYNELDETWTGIIEFSWNNINLLFDWDFNCDSNDKILELDINFKTDKKTLNLNILNWLAEVK